MRTEHLAHARVTLTVEIEAGGTWGADCTVAQVHDQGGREAVNHLKSLIGADRAVKIVGEPRVTAVMFTKENST